MHTYSMYFPCPPLQSALSILTFFSYLQLVGGIELLFTRYLPSADLRFEAIQFWVSMETRFCPLLC